MHGLSYMNDPIRAEPFCFCASFFFPPCGRADGREGGREGRRFRGWLASWFVDRSVG